MAALSCVWWNVKNLYPHVAPGSGKTPEDYRPSNEAEYDSKLRALADVLDGMPGGVPDLIMLGEVAVGSAVGGRDALDDLARRLGGNRDHYLCAEGDSRGITCGAIWDANKLGTGSPPGFHVVTRSADNAELGRPIVELHMRDRASGFEFIVYLNHWTARTNFNPVEQAKAEGSRIVAAGTLVEQLRSRLCTKGNSDADPDARVLVVGDFNDEPFNDSLTLYDYAIRDKKQIIERDPSKQEPYLHNPSWRLLGQKLRCHVQPAHQPPQWPPAGSHRFDQHSPNHWSTFDQVLISPGMLTGAQPAFQDDSLEVYCTHGMLDATGKPDWPSDHLPIRFDLQF